MRQKKVERLERQLRAIEDPSYRGVLREKARRDVLFFINQFAWTYDPRPESPPHHHPFMLYEFQEDYIRELEATYKEVQDLLTDKSRDMGVSWMVLSWILWHWLFDPSFNALIGSRKEDFVDNYLPDSAFGKLHYMLERLPKWILPDGFDLDKHRTYLKIINPESGNTIQGESANADFSRQGRYSVILLDEFAFWPWAASVWTATADSAPCRLVVSTPNGTENKFAELRHSGKIKVRSLHWPLHPHKDEAWYEAEKSRRTPKEVAQELDLDYEASGLQRVFSLKTNTTLRRNVIVPAFDLPGEYGSDKHGVTKFRHAWRMTGGFDYGTRNKSVFSVFARDYDGRHYLIYEWRKTYYELKDQGHTGSMVQAAAAAIKSCPFYDEIDLIYADPSIWVQNVSTPDGMTSLYQQFIDEGVPNLAKGAQDDKACIQRTLTLWSDEQDPGFKIFDSCTGMIDELDKLSWDEWSDAQGTKKGLKETIVDKDNHSWDTWKYYIMSRPEATSKPRPEPAESSAEWFHRRMKQGKKEWDRRHKRGLI